MAARVAFLKGINVGGHTVKMTRLAQVFEAAGCTDVRTVIASGNVVFNAAARNEAALARRIEAALLQALGFEVPTFLRTAADVAALALLNPFPGAVGGNRYVGFLESAPPPARARAVQALGNERNRFAVQGRDIHWWSAGGLTDSGFTYTVLEKAIGAGATFRGIKTVVRMASILP